MSKTNVIELRKDEWFRQERPPGPIAIKQKLRAPKELPQFLTASEVAKALRVSRYTVYDWRRSGKLRSHKIGGRVLFSMLDIADAIEKGRLG